MLVLDTSALLYWTIAESSLTKIAADAIKHSDRLLVSSISIWEIGLKVKKQHLVLPGTVKEYIEMLHEIDKLEIIAVNETIWLGNLDLEWEHRDPADRTIVATAKIYNCGLITSDSEIRKFYSLAIW